MDRLASTSLLVALVALATGFQGSELTSEQARVVLEESFPGAEVAVGKVQVAESRVVVPEQYREEPTFVVEATLSGMGDAIEVSASIRRYREAWRLIFVEHNGLWMMADELLEVVHRDRQRRTIERMRDIASALGEMRVDTGRYAEYLMELGELGYMSELPSNDAWGSAFLYVSEGPDTYALTSLGADGAPGPIPPSPWVDAPYDPEIILSDGRFVQAPTGRR